MYREEAGDDVIARLPGTRGCLDGPRASPEGGGVVAKMGASCQRWLTFPEGRRCGFRSWVAMGTSGRMGFRRYTESPK